MEIGGVNGTGQVHWWIEFSVSWVWKSRFHQLGKHTIINYSNFFVFVFLFDH